MPRCSSKLFPGMTEKITVPKIRSMKGGRIVCVTAYEAPSARIADASGVDLILVGDSVGNVVLGYKNTLPVTLEEMIHHVKAARRGCSRALLAADMPFGTFQVSVEETIRSGIELIKAGAEAVKLEGAYTEAIEGLVRAGIPVMGHIGMTPQSVNAFGGYRVQGKGEKAERLLNEANLIEEAGAFCIVLEMVPAKLAERITHEISIPTIGIGAGPHCDGEIQVFHDLLGFAPGEPYKHTRRYLESWKLCTEALKQYASDVRTKRFPTEENSF